MGTLITGASLIGVFSGILRCRVAVSNMTQVQGRLPAFHLSLNFVEITPRAVHFLVSCDDHRFMQALHSSLE
jgi:hypothetical protein